MDRLLPPIIYITGRQSYEPIHLLGLQRQKELFLHRFVKGLQSMELAKKVSLDLQVQTLNAAQA